MVSSMPRPTISLDEVLNSLQPDMRAEVEEAAQAMRGEIALAELLALIEAKLNEVNKLLSRQHIVTVEVTAATGHSVVLGKPNAAAEIHELISAAG